LLAVAVDGFHAEAEVGIYASVNHDILFSYGLGAPFTAVTLESRQVFPCDQGTCSSSSSAERRPVALQRRPDLSFVPGTGTECSPRYPSPFQCPVIYPTIIRFFCTSNSAGALNAA